jgi:hypothetical protein
MLQDSLASNLVTHSGLRFVRSPPYLHDNTLSQCCSLTLLRCLLLASAFSSPSARRKLLKAHYGTTFMQTRRCGSSITDGRNCRESVPTSCSFAIVGEYRWIRVRDALNNHNRPRSLCRPGFALSSTVSSNEYYSFMAACRRRLSCNEEAGCAPFRGSKSAATQRYRSASCR